MFHKHDCVVLGRKMVEMTGGSLTWSRYRMYPQTTERQQGYD